MTVHVVGNIPINLDIWKMIALRIIELGGKEEK